MTGSHKSLIVLDCECGKHTWALTTRAMIAIVDAEDGWILRNYKWTANGIGRSCYASRRNTRKRSYSYLHHAVTGYIHSKIDHIDGNGLNCTKQNLRPYVGKQNDWNQRRALNNKSGYKGVSRTKYGWVSYIKLKGPYQKNLGIFAFKEDAARAYNYYAAYSFGEFAHLNTVLSEFQHE